MGDGYGRIRPDFLMTIAQGESRAPLLPLCKPIITAVAAGGLKHEGYRRSQRSQAVHTNASLIRGLCAK